MNNNNKIKWEWAKKKNGTHREKNVGAYCTIIFILIVNESHKYSHSTIALTQFECEQCIYMHLSLSFTCQPSFIFFPLLFLSGKYNTKLKQLCTTNCDMKCYKNKISFNCFKSRKQEEKNCNRVEFTYSAILFFLFS